MFSLFALCLLILAFVISYLCLGSKGPDQFLLRSHSENAGVLHACDRAA